MTPTPSAWKWWAALCGALVLTLLVSHACQPDPSPVLEDTRWRDSLHISQLRWEQDSAMRVDAAQEATRRADSLQRVATAGEGRYRRLARWADSVIRVPKMGTTVPDSVSKAGAGTFNKDSASESLLHTDNSPNLDTHADGHVYERPDSEQVVPRVAYDSLYSAYETADSTVQVLHGAIREYILAAGKYAEQAVAAEGRLSQERAIYEGRITDLTAALRKQTRGCRVVGFIPCPVVGPSYSVNIGADGKPHAGFGVSVVIPIKLGGK